MRITNRSLRLVALLAGLVALPASTWATSRPAAITFDRGRMSLTAPVEWMPVLYEDEAYFQLLMLVHPRHGIISFFAAPDHESLDEIAGGLTKTNLDMLARIAGEPPLDLEALELNVQSVGDDYRREVEAGGAALAAPYRGRVGLREFDGWWVTGAVVGAVDTFSASAAAFEDLISSVAMAPASGGLACRNLTLVETAQHVAGSAARRESWNAARRGDGAACVAFAEELVQSGKEADVYDLEVLGRQLVHATYEHDDDLNESQRLRFGNRLAEMHLEWIGGFPDIALAYGILTRNASAGDPQALELLPGFLESDFVHEPNFEVARAWRRFAESGERTPAAELAELRWPESMRLPATGEFEECPGDLGRFPELAKRFHAIAAAAVDDPARLQTYVEDLREGFPEALPAVFIAYAEPAHELLKILIESVTDVRVLPEPELTKTPVFADFRWVPPLVAAALIAEELDVTLTCQGPKLRLIPGRRAPDPPQLTTVHTGLLMERLEHEDGTVTLRWNNDASYVGEIEGEIPNGPGRFEFSGGGLIEGRFVDGRLAGEGKVAIGLGLDEPATFSGHFVGGVLHGEGSRQNDAFQFSGDFQRGRFTGEGRMVVDSLGQDNLLHFEGPIVNDRAHGLGTCKSKYLEYACRYHEDFLVEIDGVSLLP